MGTVTTRTENENAKWSIKRRYHKSVLHNHHTQCSNANAIDCSLTKEHGAPTGSSSFMLTKEGGKYSVKCFYIHL